MSSIIAGAFRPRGRPRSGPRIRPLPTLLNDVPERVEGAVGDELVEVGELLRLAGMRTLDPTYPGEHPMRTVSTLVYLLVMTAGAYAGDRVVRWWERRIDGGHGDR